MAFVRTKTRNGKRHYHLVENYREDGKVRQRTIAYLGEHPTIEAAIEKFAADIQGYRQRAESYRQTAREARRNIGPRWLKNGEVPEPRRLGCSISAKMIRAYWRYNEWANSQDYWADKRQQQMDKLLAHVRSDHKSEASVTFVGTTPGEAA